MSQLGVGDKINVGSIDKLTISAVMARLVAIERKRESRRPSQAMVEEWNRINGVVGEVCGGKLILIPLSRG